MVAPDPNGQFVIANDAGLDLTLVWRFDAQAGRLLPADVPVVAAPSGSAPRHFVSIRTAGFFYNLYEHDAKIAVYDYDAAKGGLRPKQLVSTLPRSSAAAICRRKSSSPPTAASCMRRIACTIPSRFLRWRNDGQLRMISEAWVHADYPRCLTIDPSGEFLYSCNQKGDSIHLVSFEQDGRRTAIHGPLRTGGESRGHDHAEALLAGSRGQDPSVPRLVPRSILNAVAFVRTG